MLLIICGELSLPSHLTTFSVIAMIFQLSLSVL